MRVARRRPLLLPVAVVAIVAGCSSGSSGGAGPTASPSPTQVDRAAVDQVLDHVVTGLRTATAISGSAGIAAAARALHTASGELQSAGDSLNPPPAGVPAAKALAVSTGLLRIGGLLGRSGDCLTEQAAATHPSTAPCLPPLRQAEQRDASLAHGLIAIAAYGSKSPKVFERELVGALQGK